MKKEKLLLVSALIPLLSYSQITIQNDNKMGFGTLTPRYSMDIIAKSNSIDTIMIGKQGRGDKLAIEMLYNSVNSSNVNYAGFSVLPMCYPYVSKLGSPSKRWGSIYLMNDPDIVSDERLKTNIEPLGDGVLDRITSLVPISYNMKDSILGYKLTAKDAERKIVGLSAQKVKEIFPDIVNEEDGIMGIKYSALIPYLIKAIKEQNEEISRLKDEIYNIKSSESNSINKSAILYQNNPNPFDSKTEIQVFISNKYTESYIYVYDLYGNQKKKLKIEGYGDTKVTINATDLNPGMYYYSLICNDVLIDTKKMVITK